MRFASYVSHQGAPTWGVENDGHLYDLGPTGSALAPSLKDAVTLGLLGSAVDTAAAPSQAVDSTTFLPPITSPGKILCIGVNYKSHQDEVGKPPPGAPTVFTRFADTQMGHGQPAVKPPTTTQFDYEGELAVVIGSPAHLVDAADAWDVIAGYAVYNDFSVRDWQRAATQWTPGKNFPDTGGFGPYLVPTTDIPDVTTLSLQTRVNGDVRQSASVADLVFDIPAIIAYVTGFTPLSPGDVIVTGTPGGVGLFMDPQAFLSDGDVVEVEITGLGVLTNPVVQG